MADVENHTLIEALRFVKSHHVSHLNAKQTEVKLNSTWPVEKKQEVLKLLEKNTVNVKLQHIDTSPEGRLNMQLLIPAPPDEVQQAISYICKHTKTARVFERGTAHIRTRPKGEPRQKYATANA
jgi:hypothetical protein